MEYAVIIYYVLVEGEQVVESLNVKKNIEASSPEEAIGVAYKLFEAEVEAADEECYIVSIIPNAMLVISSSYSDISHIRLATSDMKYLFVPPCPVLMKSTSCVYLLMVWSLTLPSPRIKCFNSSRVMSRAPLQ